MIDVGRLNYDSRYVNITGDTMTGGLTLPWLQFDLTDTTALQEGMLRWNDDDGTLNLGLPGGTSVLQIGQEMHLRARNDTGVTITNGQVVYINGATGSRPTVALAKADAAATSDATIAIATEEVADNTSGIFTTFGLVRDLDTSAFAAGAELYLSAATAGAFTDTEPVSPNHKVKLGYVIVSNPTEGVILFNVDTGGHLGDLHDVSESSLADLDLLQYDAGNSYWKNVTIADALDGTYLRIDGGNSPTADIDWGGYDLVNVTQLAIGSSSVAGGYGLDCIGSVNMKGEYFVQQNWGDNVRFHQKYYDAAGSTIEYQYVIETFTNNFYNTAYSRTGAVTLNYDASMGDGTSAATIRYLRGCNTTGNSRFDVYRANGANEANHRFWANNSLISYFSRYDGSMVIGSNTLGTAYKFGVNGNTWLNGSMSEVHETKTASFTAGSKRSYGCDASGGAIVVTLPTASLTTGVIYTFAKIDTSANTVNVGGVLTLYLPNETINVKSDGSNWIII